MSDKETVFWFGKHKDKDLSEVPAGYLRWMVENFDPKTLEAVQAMEDRMRDFLSAAEDEVNSREES